MSGKSILALQRRQRVLSKGLDVGPVMDRMEERNLMSATLAFDADGVGGDAAVPNLLALDWSPGNLLGEGMNAALQQHISSGIAFTITDRGTPGDTSDDLIALGVGGTSDPFSVHYQAKLQTMLLSGGGIHSPAGLNTSYEITVVAQFNQRVTSILQDNLLGQTLVNFANVTDSSQYLEIYHGSGSSFNASDLTGAGFNDGTMILKADVVSTQFQSNFVKLTQTSLLDQAASDNYAGQLTVEGSGSIKFLGAVTAFNSDYFIDVPSTVGFEETTNGNSKLPFQEAEPSARFLVDANGTAAGATPILSGVGAPSHPTLGIGAVNGASSIGSGANQGGASIQFQSDSNTSFNRPVIAAIGDYVWLDKDADGIQDGDEVGIPNVTVRLLDSANTVLDSMVTDADGKYLFSNLTPGDYKIQFVAPSGFIASDANQGVNDAADSDGEAGLITVLTTLVGGETDLTWDQGFYELAEIGDYVWEDKNADGKQDGTEPGIENVKVELYNCANPDVVLATQFTDADGKYLFTGLKPGTYHVKFHTPTGYFLTTQDVVGSDALDSDANVLTGQTICTTLESGESDLTWDAGMYKKAELGDYVWEDKNADGKQDGTEPGIENVKVELYNCANPDVVIATQFTDVNGKYLFTNLTPGTYHVKFTTPNGYITTTQDVIGSDALDSDANTITGQTICTTLESGESDLTWDAGYYKLAEIGDYVWEDKNADGKQDGTEPGIENVKVELYNCENPDVVIATQFTDADGKYLFTGLKPGTYHVKFTTPAGYVITTQDVGGDDAIDSDANVLTGQTICTTLESGESDKTWDAGMYKPAELGDYVWEDKNVDGKQDGNEPGIQNVKVELYNCENPDVVVATQFTDADGKYLFTNLKPGTYHVKFYTPTGYFLTTQDVGANDALDSDANVLTGQTICTVLESGESDKTWDAGMFRKAALGDYVWFDADQDGQQDGNEAGVANVTVHLLNTSDVIIGTQLTNATGFYLFGDLMPGDYKVQFVLPGGFTGFTLKDTGNDASDSDADLVTGKTGVYNLESGETDLTVDAGVYLVVSTTPKINIEKLVCVDDDAACDCDSDGHSDGKSDGKSDGHSDGKSDGKSDGNSDGKSDGKSDGHSDGKSDGKSDGHSDGKSDGKSDGHSDGKSDGKSDGHSDGKSDGKSDGHSDGKSDGKSDGHSDGKSDGKSDGHSDGKSDGKSDGHSDGKSDGKSDGHSDGKSDGKSDGSSDGKSDGKSDGHSDGKSDGKSDGHSDGKSDGKSDGGVDSCEDCEPVDADTAGEAVNANFGDTIKFKYVVTNPGDVEILNVIVKDDNATPGNPADDFIPAPTLTLDGYNVGDLDKDNRLDTNEAWLYTASITAASVGLHTNLGTVTGNSADGQNVTDNDPANYLVAGFNPDIDLEKYVRPYDTGTSTGGTEGLTPGYWKQSHHFDDWTTYTTGMSYNSVFGVNDTSGMTLLGALSRGGGGAAALGRHAVAALLNAAHANLDYAFTEAQVISMVQQAYATGNFENVKGILAAENEKEGDINSGGSGGGGSSSLGSDADTTSTAPTVKIGDKVVFTYLVKNTGDVALSNVTVKDDNGTPANTADDFFATPVLDGTFNVGDIDKDGKLDLSETWKFTACRTMTAVGTYTNVAKVTGTSPDAQVVTDEDPANVIVVQPAAPKSTISGFVYKECDNDGKKESGENGIAGVTIKLTGTDKFGNAVSKTTTTDANGYYKFENLVEGTYKLCETQPAGYADGKDSAGTSGGTVSNDMISAINLAAGVNAQNYNFAELGTSALTGYVYADKDNDGKKEYGEGGIAGIKITLTGKDDLGNNICIVTYTDANGFYKFEGLRAGCYAIAAAQSSAYNDGKESVGSLGGCVGADKITSIYLDFCETGCNYNFGERPKTGNWC